MKILFCVRDYYNFSGGAEKCLDTFFSLLIDDGNEIRVLTRMSGLFTKPIKINHKKITLIPVLEKNLEDELFRQIKKFSPDFIVSQLQWSERVFRATRNFRIPKIFFVKHIRDLKQESTQELLRLYPIDIIVINSEYSKKYIKKSLYPKQKVILSYPLIDYKKYRIKNRSKKSTSKFVTMINFRQEKGSELFKELARVMPGKKFLAINSWQTFNKGEKKQQANLYIEGPYEDVREVYKKTQILLVPSFGEEIFARVILEAMINGIPVIGSNVGGISEALGQNGVLINDFNNINSWKNALRKFEDPSYYLEMSEKALRQAEGYSLENEYEQILSAMKFCFQEEKSFFSKQKKLLFLLELRLARYFYYLSKKVFNKLKYSLLNFDRKIFSKLFLTLHTTASPISDSFGFDRGGPIDRYYIEQFLKIHSRSIQGKILEVGDDRYTQQFGHNIKNLDILNVKEGLWDTSIVDDLSNPHKLPFNYYDCFICTQTLHCIYNCDEAIQNSLKVLKKGGTLLITVPGISPLSLHDYQDWGQFWTFTEMSLRKLLEKYAPKENILIYSYGNLKSSVAFLYGYSWKELRRNELDEHSLKFPITIAAAIKK
jgi:glycosyltransferase involved in cell wall biosynthesis